MKTKTLLTILAFILYAGVAFAQKPIIQWVDIAGGTFTMGRVLPAGIKTNKPDGKIYHTGFLNSIMMTYNPDGSMNASDSYEIIHTVTLSSFRISKYEITVSQFKVFVDSTGYLTDAEKGTGNIQGSYILGFDKNLKYKRVSPFGDKSSSYKAAVNWKCDEKGIPLSASDFNRPVIHVSWNDAKAFADWIGSRLPTEAEWDYACRAGTNTKFNTGNKLSVSQANCYSKGILPVGSFPANQWGLCDMHGNVSEWCNDWFGGYPEDPQTNPIGPSTGTLKIHRGGGWYYNWWYCESTLRYACTPFSRFNYVGFRLAIDE